MKLTLELTKPQMKELYLIVRNGYGDGSYYDGKTERERNTGVRAIQVFQNAMSAKASFRYPIA